MYRAANCSVVTLIPKHKGAKEIQDYRPIACCSTLYKIISKILANRLSKVLGMIIGANQAAFVKGQRIHNHILITYELIKGYERKNISPRCLMQMDIQKAYDAVDWNALEKIFNEVGCPQQFTKWVMTMVSTISYRFNINGHQTDIMAAKRGLRHGDPISPMLFVIVMECLNKYLDKMQEDCDFNYHPKCDKLKITNLCFADDLLMFSRGDKVSVEMMMKTYGKFLKATGLAVNPQKCQIYCAGMDELTRQNVIKASGFQEGRLPFKYLGVPVTGKKLSMRHYAPLIDKIMGKIKHWTTRLLTYARRLQLINCVMFVMTNYWLTCFPFPKTVIHKIESICRIFLWTRGFEGSRKAPVAWKQVCSPRSHGGLNVIDIKVWNKTTL
ncbi:unnamed protein product [Lathyrus sativus]|nr:unnamed protein product [Lathyrus sativus]